MEYMAALWIIFSGVSVILHMILITFAPLMSTHHRQFTFTIYLLMCYIMGYGQFSGQQFSGRPSNIPPPSDTVSVKPPLNHRYFLSADLNNILPFQDTGLDRSMEIVDPTRLDDQRWVHLGYMGSSAASLIYEYQVNEGFNMGFSQYDIYKQGVDQLRFYKSNRTVADMAFYQISGNKNNFISKADYFQEFKGNWSLSLNFKRFNFTHNYQSAANQSTNFSLGLLYDKPGSKRKGYVALINNYHNETFNGGIVDTVGLLSSPFRSSVQVALDDNKGRHSEQVLHGYVEQQLFGSKVASFVDVQLADKAYFYYDNGALNINDSMVYRSFIGDERGLRYRTSVKSLAGAFGINVKPLKALDLRIMLQNDLYQIADIETKYRNDLTLKYDGLLDIKRKWKVKLAGHLGLGANAGNFLLRAGSQLNVGKWMQVDAGWSSYLRETGLIDQRLVINEVTIYENDFKKVFGTRFDGALMMPKLGVSIRIRQDIVNNALYWNSEAMPMQSSSVYSHSLAQLNWKLQIRKIGIENGINYQVMSNNIYHLPEWYSTHDIHFEAPMFKRAVTLRVGTNARVVPFTKANSFMPVTGRFYQGEDQTVLYPDWTIYLSARIQTFRVVVEYDNVTSFGAQLVNTRINRYPYLDGNLRFGVRWLLLD